MEALKQFLAMGGYAFYVWSAYGITFLIFMWNIQRALRHASRS